MSLLLHTLQTLLQIQPTILKFLNMCYIIFDFSPLPDKLGFPLLPLLIFLWNIFKYLIQLYRYLVNEWKLLSRLWLFVTPMDYTVHGILQTRILEWVAFPFSMGSSQLRDWTRVSPFAGGFFNNWSTREALLAFRCYIYIYHFFLLNGICHNKKLLKNIRPNLLGGL